MCVPRKGRLDIGDDYFDFKLAYRTVSGKCAKTNGQKRGYLHIITQKNA